MCCLLRTWLLGTFYVEPQCRECSVVDTLLDSLVLKNPRELQPISNSSSSHFMICLILLPICISTFLILIFAFTFSSLCPCAFGSGTDRPAVEALTLAYQAALRDLISSGRYDDTSDFSVVIQPLFREATPPTNRVRSHLLMEEDSDWSGDED